MSCVTGVTPYALSPATTALFGSRVSSLSLLYQDYRITRLSVKMYPDYNSDVACAVEMEQPETTGVSTVAQMSNYSHFVYSSTGTSVPVNLDIDRQGCLIRSASRWFKTSATAQLAEAIQGSFLTYSTNTVTLPRFYIMYEIQFCNPITSGLGLHIATGDFEEVSSSNSVSVSSSGVLVPPPTGRAFFSRK